MKGSFNSKGIVTHKLRTTDIMGYAELHSKATSEGRKETRGEDGREEGGREDKLKRGLYKLLAQTVYLSLMVHWSSQTAEWVKVLAASNLRTDFHLQISP